MYIKVKAFPNSKKETFEKVQEFTYEAHVKEKAERNEANKRIIELVARELGVREEDVRIINGHQSRSKLLSINKLE